jgi:hypothetical protein
MELGDNAQISFDETDDDDDDMEMVNGYWF